MTTWTPAATAAVILAACLGIGWAAAFITAATAGDPQSREAVTYLAGLGQTVAGAAVALVGISIGQRRNGKGGNGTHD